VVSSVASVQLLSRSRLCEERQGPEDETSFRTRLSFFGLDEPKATNPDLLGKSRLVQSECFAGVKNQAPRSTGVPIVTGLPAASERLQRHEVSERLRAYSESRLGRISRTHRDSASVAGSRLSARPVGSMITYLPKIISIGFFVVGESVPALSTTLRKRTKRFILRSDAGVVQWQNRSFPSFLYFTLTR
jgi:hypothetical protein